MGCQDTEPHFVGDSVTSQPVRAFAMIESHLLGVSYFDADLICGHSGREQALEWTVSPISGQDQHRC